MEDSNRYSPRNLFLISFSILFLEMACIRWLNASVSVLAYFNNLILLSCFLGLGVGCLLASRKINLIYGYPLAFLTLVGGVMLLRQHAIEISYTDDVVFAQGYDASAGVLSVSLAALAGFLINLVLYIILGQELGKQLKAMDNPLRAYAYDIGGSILGVCGYVVLAWMHTPPYLWYAIGVLLLLVFLRNKKWLATSVVILGVAIFLMASSDKFAIWSPYYKVECIRYKAPENRELGYMVNVDNLRIQDALNMTDEHLKDSPLWSWYPYYELGYHYIAPQKALLLGAGCGNEAVMALIHQVPEIHAVEIDPTIAHIGRGLHPNKPYEGDKVKLIVNDARAYISDTDETYDLIVMSALDSHRQIGGMSSLRLESFMYTVEAFAKIKTLMNPGGIFVLNVASTRPWIGKRTYWSLTKAFGSEPRVLQTEKSPFGSKAYVYGPDEAFERDLMPDASPVTQLAAYPPDDSVRLATDNWPFLYLEKNSIPTASLIVLAVMLLLSVFLVCRVEPSIRRPNFHFFFLGAGFMLLETRSITQMALLFGSTWNVNAVVFISILITIFVANYMVMTNKTPTSNVSYVLLVITLILGFFFPFASLLKLSLVLRLGAALIVIGLPILWASFIFSTSFKDVKKIDTAFGSNLLGVVCGGCIEYTSNIWGLNVLYLIALGLYVVSFLYMPRRAA